MISEVVLGAIILIILFMGITEILYFLYFIKDEDGFVIGKLKACALSLTISFFLFGIPFIYSVVPSKIGETPYGPIAYVWYYSILFPLLLFFGINYIIYLWLKKKEEKNGSN